MAGSRSVECGEHGRQPATFVCQHIAQSLLSGNPIGFFWSADAEEERPEAWCAACDELVARCGGDRTGEAAEHLGAKLLCAMCYDRVRALNLIPVFDKALQKFRDFLLTEGRSGQIVWAFREDMYREESGRYQVLWPLPVSNEAAVRGRFETGRRRGLVGLEALCYWREWTVATVLVPQPDEIQGWPVGLLKLSIASPFSEASTVLAGLWPLHRSRPAYRRFQATEPFVPLRSSSL